LSIASKVLSVDAGSIDHSGLAGDGLTWDAGNSELDVNVGDGLEIVTDTVQIDLATTSGLAFSSGDLAVGAGDGINVLTSTIEVDVTDLIGAGLVEIATNNIGLADSVAGDGLAIDSGTKVISVNVGDGLEIATDTGQVDLTATSGLEFSSGDLQIADSIAGTGLSIASKVISVDLTSGAFDALAGDGLAWDGVSDEIDLGTPDTLAYNSTNAVTVSSHTHEITASSAPSGESLLQSDSNSGLELGRLGVGVSPSYFLHIEGAATPQFRLAYNGSNYADFSVSSGGNMTVEPIGNFIFNPTGDYVLPVTNYDINLGSLSKKYLSLHAAELVVETLVAQDTIGTIGGRVLIGPTTQLISDLNSSTVSLAETLTNGDMETWFDEYSPGTWLTTGTGIRRWPISRGGSFSVQLAPSAGEESYLSQLVSVSSSTEYQVSGWVRIENADYPAPRYAVTDVTNVTYLISETEILGTVGQWVQFRDSFITASNTTQIGIYILSPIPTGRESSAAFLQGTPGDLSDSQGSYISGVDAASAARDSIGAYISVGDGAVSSQSAYISGPGHDLDSVGAYILGDDNVGALFDDISVTLVNRIEVKHNEMGNGDVAYMESDGKIEFLTVVGGAHTISGGYWYGVDRDVDGTGANQWYAGDAVFNTGVAGNGFIDLYSFSGVGLNGIGPTIVGNVRNSKVYNDWTEHWAIGNLSGIYGYAVDTYGVALGNYGSNHITIDDTNGIRFIDDSLSVIGQWSGSVIIVGDENSGQYVRVDSTGVELYGNSTKVIDLNSSGDAIFGQVGNSQGNVMWNSSNKRLEFRGGSLGESVQAYIDTDGSFVAGDGALTLNSDGLRILTEYLTDWTTDSKRKIEFISPDSSSILATIDAFERIIDHREYLLRIGLQQTLGGFLPPVISFNSSEIGGDGIRIDPGTKPGVAVVVAGQFVTNSGNVFSSTSGVRIEGGVYIGATSVAPTVNWVQVLGDISASGGLYVGNASGNPASGEIETTGDVHIGGSIVESTAIMGVWTRTTDTNINHAATTTVPWENEEHDTDGMWTSGTDIVIQTAGTYIITGEVEWENASDFTSRQCLIVTDVGTLAQARGPAMSDGATHQIVSVINEMDVGEFIRLVIRQQSGGAIDYLAAKIHVARIA